MRVSKCGFLGLKSGFENGRRERKTTVKKEKEMSRKQQKTKANHKMLKKGDA